MTVTGNHWMFDWIDEFEILDASDAHNRWHNRSSRERLYQLVSAPPKPIDVPLSGAVVAGLGLDLASRFTCYHDGCRIPVADTDYSQILHYFDCAVMEGPSALLYRRSIESRDFEALAGSLEQDISVMLHLREIGLSNYIVFEPRDCFCEMHTRKKAEMLGMQELYNDDHLLKIATSLSKSGLIDITGDRYDWFASVRLPQFNGAIGHTIRKKTKPKKVEAALEILQDQVREMIYDASAANRLGTALASVADPRYFTERFDSNMMELGSQPLTVDEIALRVRLPVLSGMSTADLIRIREQNSTHFDRFRALMDESILATIEEAKTESPDVAADYVWKRKIKPQLTELEQAIDASSRAFHRKIAGASVVGAVVAIGTTLSAVAGAANAYVGTAIGSALGGVSVLTSTMNFLSKRAEEKQSFETSGTYFLWRANKLRSHD